MKPGKGSAFVRTKVKNLVTGNSLEKTFRAVSLRLHRYSIPFHFILRSENRKAGRFPTLILSGSTSLHFTFGGLIR